MNLILSWIDSVIDKWILEVVNMWKISSIKITFLKYNMEMKHSNIRLIHEKGIPMNNNLNIKNRIFRKDSVYPLLFVLP